MQSSIYPPILRRKTVISVPWSFQQSMDYTVRITAAVFFRSGNGKPLVKTHEKTQNKNVNNDGNLRL